MARRQAVVGRGQPAAGRLRGRLPRPARPAPGLALRPPATTRARAQESRPPGDGATASRSIWRRLQAPQRAADQAEVEGDGVRGAEVPRDDLLVSRGPRSRTRRGTPGRRRPCPPPSAITLGGSPPLERDGRRLRASPGGPPSPAPGRTPAPPARRGSPPPAPRPSTRSPAGRRGSRSRPPRPRPRGRARSTGPSTRRAARSRARFQSRVCRTPGRRRVTGSWAPRPLASRKSLTTLTGTEKPAPWLVASRASFIRTTPTT